MYSDTHIHSKFSGDSQADPEEILKKAIDCRMKYVCFTDHQDFDLQNYDISFELNTKEYYEEISKLKSKYADKIEVLIGVETGLEIHQSEKLTAFTKLVPFDYVIGSSHMVNHKDPYYPEFFKDRSDHECFEEYFLSIIDILKVHTEFDVYGHLDYIIRYAPNKNKNYRFSIYQDYIDEILKQLIYLGKGIEVNTGGYRYQLNSPNPGRETIKRYKELGGEIITLASDAHTPEYLGYQFDEAAHLLSICGFKYYNIFKQRKPVFLPLNEH